MPTDVPGGPRRRAAQTGSARPGAAARRSPVEDDEVGDLLEAREPHRHGRFADQHHLQVTFDDVAVHQLLRAVERLSYVD